MSRASDVALKLPPANSGPTAYHSFPPLQTPANAITCELFYRHYGRIRFRIQLPHAASSFRFPLFKIEPLHAETEAQAYKETGHETQQTNVVGNNTKPDRDS